MKKNRYLNAEEKDIIESYENDEWQSINDLEKEEQVHAQYARNTSIKNKCRSIPLGDGATPRD